MVVTAPKKAPPPSLPRASALCYRCAHRGDEHSGREPFVCYECPCGGFEVAPTETEREKQGQLRMLDT